MPKLKNVGKLFPTLRRELASYDPGTFIIELNDIKYTEFEQFKSNPLDVKNIENIKTLFHELRHSVDHVSTLWGQRYIVKYIKAINARAKNDLDNFYTIIDYLNEGEQLTFDKYFMQIYGYAKYAGIDKRWKADPTIGSRFTSEGKIDHNRPIPFINFSTFDNKPLVRIPISVASLLETNAKAEEIFWHIQHINTYSANEAPFHLKLFAQETLANLIYEPDLVLYNAAVHLCANLLDISDILEAFKISSKIATLALNIPNSLIGNIQPILFNDIEYDNKRKRMIANHEYGFIYSCLLENYKSKYNESGDKENRQFDIEKVLESSSLPTVAKIKEVIAEEMDNLFTEAQKYDHFQGFFLNKLSKGKLMFLELGVDMPLTISKALNKANYKPYIVCDDNTEILPGNITSKEMSNLAPFNNLSNSDWYNVAWHMGMKMKEFYEIRGV